jgi:hypothetical protein
MSAGSMEESGVACPPSWPSRLADRCRCGCRSLLPGCGSYDGSGRSCKPRADPCWAKSSASRPSRSNRRLRIEVVGVLRIEQRVPGLDWRYRRSRYLRAKTIASCDLRKASSSGPCSSNLPRHLVARSRRPVPRPVQPESLTPSSLSKTKRGDLVHDASMRTLLNKALAGREARRSSVSCASDAPISV